MKHRVLQILFLALSMAGLLSAQGSIGTQIVQGAKTNNNAAPSNTSVGVLPCVATASTPSYTEGNQVACSTDLTGALRVAGSAGGTSSSFGSAFPSTGTAAGFSDGTNMVGARAVDLDTGGGVVTGLIVNLVRRASGGPTEMIGQTTMALSLPVVLPSDQSAIPVSQSATWTVQPGNTPNTTPWLVRSLPDSSCTGAFQDLTTTDVATGAGTDVTTANTCVYVIRLTNVTASTVTYTIRDRQGTPVEYAEAELLAANSSIRLEFDGMLFNTGVKIIAGTASALNARTVGRL